MTPQKHSADDPEKQFDAYMHLMNQVAAERPSNVQQVELQ